MGIQAAGGENNLVLGLLNQPRPSACVSTVSRKCAAPAESRAGCDDANNHASAAGWRMPGKTFSVFIPEQFSCSATRGVHMLKRKECRLHVSLHSSGFISLKLQCLTFKSKRRLVLQKKTLSFITKLYENLARAPSVVFI